MFRTGSPVTGVEFIDRKKHIPEFMLYLDSRQHIMIKAPRRFGKTSLIKYVVETDSKYSYVYIDVRRVVTLKTLSNQILDKAYSFVGVENFIRKSKESLIGLLRTVQAINLGDIADITLEYIEKDDDEIELFLHTLDLVDKIALKKEINIKFVFDEFQDILNLADKSILEKFRSVVQHHQNITYVFLGSIEAIMTQIFEDKKSPFFHFAKIINLGGLDVAEVLDYTFEEFSKKNIKYDEEAISEILRFLGGHPDYSMQVMQGVYFKAVIDETFIDKALCLNVLKLVILDNKAYLDELIQKTKTKKHLFSLLDSIANDKTSDLESKTLYNSHMLLEDMGLIRRTTRGKYEVVDIFLRVLLQQDSKNSLLDENNLKVLLTGDIPSF